MRVDLVLTHLIEERGISARQLSRRLRAAAGRPVASPTTVGKWLTPEGDPRLSELQALADFFGVSVPALLGAAAAAAEPPPPPDEAMAVEYYREIRAAVGQTKALMELLELARRVAPHPTFSPDAGKDKDDGADRGRHTG